ncbi:MAG: hypothetical protein AAF402_15675 [Pseudomonadota bacterium]
MLNSTNRKVRRVIPRWHTASKNIELRHVSGDIRNKPVLGLEHFDRAFSHWERTHHPDAAIELASTFLAFGDSSPISRQELENLFLTVGRCDAGLGLLRASGIPVFEDRDGLTIIDQLRYARTATRKQPNNALAWLDLARCYTLLGIHSPEEGQGSLGYSKSMRAVLAACQIAPNNRYVVRVAVRYFIHLGMPDRAVALLTRTSRTKYDPWMSSALVAAREVMGSPQRDIKKIRQLAQSANWSNHCRGELLAGLASLEAKNGSERNAKKILNSALVEPTENVLAQAQWFSNIYRKIDLPENLLDDLNAFEAIESRAFLNGDWDEVITSAKSWQKIEPFSKRPALNGSMVALSVLDDVSSALELLEPAHLSNPRDSQVTNNYVVGLILSGKLERAKILLKSFSSSANQLLTPTLKATHGMVAFRSGDANSGRENYKSALKEMLESKDLRTAFMCCLYWSREEALIGASDRASRLTKESKDIYKNYKFDKLTSAALTTLGTH